MPKSKGARRLATLEEVKKEFPNLPRERQKVIVRIRNLQRELRRLCEKCGKEAISAALRGEPRIAK